MPNITKEDFKQDLQELVDIENQKQMNLAVLFENSLANSKEIRLTEFKDRLYVQANYYNTLEKYQLEIDDLVTQYKKQLDKLFDVCSTRYINIQRELATAVQSEIIVVTNISINKQNLEKAIEENDAEKIHYYTNKINASIQKKLNYETIVNECNSRLEACIDQISDFSEKIKIEAEYKLCLDCTFYYFIFVFYSYIINHDIYRSITPSLIYGRISVLCASSFT